VHEIVSVLAGESGESRLRDLHVMLRGIEARADAPDHLAIDDGRPIKLSHTGQRVLVSIGKIYAILPSRAARSVAMPAMRKRAVGRRPLSPHQA